jgi:hypothetical protein
MRDKRSLLWFLFRNTLKQAWKGNFGEVREGYYLIRLTLTYKSRRIDKETKL